MHTACKIPCAMTPLKPYAVTLLASSVLAVDSCVGTAVGVGAAGGASYAYCGTSGWVARVRTRGERLETETRVSSSKTEPISSPMTFTLLHPDPKLEIVAASMVTAGGNVEWARRALFADGAEPSPKAFDAAAAAPPPRPPGGF